MLDGLNITNPLPLAALEVGRHLYWRLGNLQIHGQVFLTTWFVIGLLLIAAVAATQNVQRIPRGIQNLMEYALEYIRNLAKDQIGEKEYEYLFVVRSGEGLMPSVEMRGYGAERKPKAEARAQARAMPAPAPAVKAAQ